MINNVACVLCQIVGVAELISPELRDDSSGRFKVVRCLTCGHVQLTPLPTVEEESTFYQADRQTRNLLGTPDLTIWQRKSRADTERRVQWIQRLTDTYGGEILDIGCGYGFVVDSLARIGYGVLGLDVSVERLALARSHHKGTFIQGEVDKDFVRRNRRRFTIVSLFHVLEHVRTPVLFLERCFELIAPGGWLLIEVPNLADELLNQQPEYRSFYWQRAHLSYFEGSHLELALRKAGAMQFEVAGVQRYGLRNLLHWLDQRTPQLSDPEYEAKETALQRVEALYRADRERHLACDTLIATVRLTPFGDS